MTIKPATNEKFVPPPALGYVSDFKTNIAKFNRMYNLPSPTYPTFSGVNYDESTRLANFKATLLKEIDEVDDILKEASTPVEPGPEGKFDKEASIVNMLTQIADWLGDIQVYAASEMRKFGLDNDIVLSLIMQSNFSKLNKDGSTSYDEAGKVLKGPDYWKPEPSLLKYIKKSRKDKRDADALKVALEEQRVANLLRVKTRVTIEVTHLPNAEPNLAELVAARAFTIDKVVDSVVVTTETLP